jgi:hypothetical protein
MSDVSQQEYVDEITKRMREDDARNKTEAEQLKPIVLASLKENKITRAVASYSGSGDSGQVDHVSLYRGDNELSEEDAEAIRVSVPKTRSKFNDKKKVWERTTEIEETDLPDAIREMAYFAVEANFAGWENNDGASGELEIDVETGNCKLGHNTYRTESDYDEVSI